MEDPKPTAAPISAGETQAQNQMICPVCGKPMHLEYGENGQDVWCHANGEAEIECEELRKPLLAPTPPLPLRDGGNLR